MWGWSGLAIFFLHIIACGAIEYCSCFEEARERYRGRMDPNVEGSLLYSHLLPLFCSTLVTSLVWMSVRFDGMVPMGVVWMDVPPRLLYMVFSS